MKLETKIDRSVFYFITDLFSSTPFIHVVDSFPQETLELPTVAVEMANLSKLPYELGNYVGLNIIQWYIDIFAKDKNQRDEYAFNIANALEAGVPVYNYELGYPPTVVPQIGILQPDEINIKFIKVIPELVETLYYRSMVSFLATYEHKPT